MRGLLAVIAVVGSGCGDPVSSIGGDVELVGIEAADYATLELRAFPIEHGCRHPFIPYDGPGLMRDTLALGEIELPAEFLIDGEAEEPRWFCLVGWLDRDSNGWLELGDPWAAVPVELAYLATHTPAYAEGITLKLKDEGEPGL